MTVLQPLAHWPAAQRAALAGVFTDIDDTLTTDGEITADALQALHQLRAGGLQVIAVTGRPVGWSEPFAAAWPVGAIVAENGAVALVRDATGHLRKLYQQPPAERAANFDRMQQVLARIEQEIPGARRAQDSAGRETDIAIDHSEFTQLPQDRIDQVVALMRSEGMTATVSSIHVNGWYGSHDKLAGARWIARELLDLDLDRQLDRWAYVGDSTNDERMFQHFAHSVGVANIRRFAAQLAHLPAWVTQGERGAGFAELAQALLSARPAAAEQAARRVTVRGRVQGVGYRFSCVQQARELGLQGWVRNRADGSVEAHVQGDASRVARMCDWMRSEVLGARVDAIDVAESRAEVLHGFEQRPTA